MQKKKGKNVEISKNRRTRRTGRKIKNTKAFSRLQTDAFDRMKDAVAATRDEFGASRKFGIDLVGEVPWGTHFCQFYATKDDLTDILVPYFAAGLKNNEFCMWVTSPPLEIDEAKNALTKAIPNLDEHIANGQIEILSYADWYLLGGEFDADRVLKGWVKKEKTALKRGFEGLRLTGNTFWVERSGWNNFADYEATVNEVIVSHRMIALCTYSLQKCSGSDVVDVIRNHVGTLIRKGKVWYLVEDVAERKKMEASLQRERLFSDLLVDSSEEEMRNIVKFPSENPNPVLRVARDGTILYSNSAGLPFLNERNCEVGGLAPDNWCRLVAEALDSGARKEFDEDYGQSAFSFLAVPVPASGYVNIYGRDITKHTRTEEALRRSEEKYRSLVEPNIIGILSANIERIMEANDAFLDIVGYTRQDLLEGKIDWRKMTPSEYTARDEQALQELVAKGRCTPFEKEYFRKDGSRVPILIGAALLQREPLQWVCFVLDITERQRAEQALQESQRDLNRAQAVAKTGSWRLDVRRDELLWSDETHRMFGIPKATPMTYEAFLGTVHPDDREYVDQKWKAALNGEPYDIEHRIIVDGRVKWVRERAELEFNEDGVLLGGFGTVQDVTEHKQIQDKLFQSEKKYRTLYETTLDGIVSVDMNGHITECNDAYASMLSYSKDELKTMTYQQLTPEKWHQMEEEIVREQIIKRGYSDLYEKEYTRKDGSIFPISIRIWLIRDEKYGPAGMWGIVRDITRSKQMENELKRYSEHLERLVEERTQKLKNAERLAAVGETAAMVGHDIRNPLQTLEGAVYLAKEEIKSMPSRTAEINNVEEMLNTIQEEATYVDKIVSDLQDYARPLIPELEETNLQQLINDVILNLSKPQNIELSLQIEPDCCIITVDPTMMKRILANIITNAIQAMPNGGKLTIKTYQKEEQVYLEIQDSGVGIPEENRSKIFQPLFSTKAKGQGFGLAVVQRMVEAHNGEITFKSEVGKGTTFTIMIPVAKEVT